MTDTDPAATRRRSAPATLLAYGFLILAFGLLLTTLGLVFNGGIVSLGLAVSAFGGMFASFGAFLTFFLRRS